ncbi:MAG: S53 family peptidase [Ktedonobacteraceae bacterium]
MLTQLRAHIRKLSIVNAVCLAFLILVVSACGGSTTTTPTPTPGIQYVALDLGIPQSALNAPITGALPANQVIHVGVTFKTNQAAIDQWNKATGKNHVQKGSADASTIANQLGITDSEYQQIKSFFGVKDATLTLNKLHTYMAVDAKVSTVNQVFHTKLVQHQLNGRTYYTPDPSMPPQVPTAIASQIVSVTGLDNYSTLNTGISASAMQPVSAMTQRRPADCSPASSTYNTSQIAAVYGYNQFWQQGFKGQGMTVNLVEIDTYFPPDINNFAQCVGFNTNNLHLSTVDGLPPPSSEPPIESTLDIDMLMGLAPQSTINDYQTGLANDQGVNDALQQIINDNAKNVNSASVVSISLGGAENGETSAGVNAINSSLEQLVQVEHMTVFVSTGDCAAYGAGTYGQLNVQFPASDPYAVAVGGTEWSAGSNGTINESAWSDGSASHSSCNNSWGSGGGLSTMFKRPSWEQGNGINNQYSNGDRQEPDISALASQIAVYALGGWQSVGGTSAATPIWAAGLMLVNQALIHNDNGTYYYSPGLFYEAINTASNSSQPYNDVTQGNNLFYPTTAGWDYATGWGSPNLTNFYNILLHDAQSGS